MEEKTLYTPAEAVQYLAEQRNMKVSVGALRMKRHRGQVTTARRLERISLWTKEELDAIPLPRKRGRKPRKQQTEEHVYA